MVVRCIHRLRSPMDFGDLFRNA
uniref:Uncharacterized protein n=1 Tax=Arundo donax TaxID=35708 RepID=A0A0A9FB87_ARUDO